MMIKTNTKRNIVFLAFALIGVIGLSLSSNLFTLVIFSVILTIVNTAVIGSEGKKLNQIKLLTVNLISDIALITGSLLLYSITRTFSIAENITAIQDNIISGPFYTAISILFIISVLGKSASLPFHFWLTTKENISESSEGILLSVSMFPVGILMFLKVGNLIFSQSATILFTVGIINIFYGLFLTLSKAGLRDKIKMLAITQTGIILLFLSIHNFGGALFVLLSVTLSRLALLIGEKLIRQNVRSNKLYYWMFFASVYTFIIGIPVFIQYYMYSALLTNQIYTLNNYYFWPVQCLFIFCIFTVSFIFSGYLLRLNLNSFGKITGLKSKDFFSLIPVIILILCSVILPYIITNVEIQNLFSSGSYIFIASFCINLFSVFIGFFISYLYVLKKGKGHEISYPSFSKSEDHFDNYFAGILIDNKSHAKDKTITVSGTINKIFSFSTLSSYLGISLLIIVIFYFIFRSM